MLSIITKYASSNISSSWICSMPLSELRTLSCLLLDILSVFSNLWESGGDETGDTGADTDIPVPGAELYAKAGWSPKKDMSNICCFFSVRYISAISPSSSIKCSISSLTCYYFITKLTIIESETQIWDLVQALFPFFFFRKLSKSIPNFRHC